MERNVDEAIKLIKFYNLISGSSLSPRSSAYQETVFTCLERVGGDPVIVKNHIRKWCRENDGDSHRIATAEAFEECLEAIDVNSGKSATTAGDIALSMEILSKAVTSCITPQQISKIESDIMGSVQEDVRTFIANEYGPIERKITTVVDGKKKDIKGLLHEKFDTVLKFVANDEPVFLTGPAGSGKNYICKQVADALDLKFYFSNAVTQEYKLTGFTDANGNYQPTQFYKAFTEGGLFMLDEIDASIPEVLVILNAAIANRYFDFPAPIGYVEAHPDFRVVAAGNTTGHGADYEYVGRNQLDGASLDRFAIIDIDYSPTIENGLAGEIDLANFCREFRKVSQKVGVGIIVSYRAISRLAKMLQVLDINEALKTCLVKDLGKDDLNIITKELHTSKYKTSLQEICSAM